MRLLFDENLSRRLVGMLRDAFPDSVHVVDVELDTAADREIWEYAGERNLIVVSKDSDFHRIEVFVDDDEEAMLVIPASSER